MIRVVLVDDHALMREGLRSLFNGQADMTVVADASNGRAALALILKHKPDVIIMDVSMPSMNGMDATRQILEQQPTARIIALSIHRDHRFVSGMYKAGALGYVLKDNVFEQLLQAVKTVMRGHRYICPDLADILVESLSAPGGGHTAPLDKLTPRERQTLQLLAEGYSIKRSAVHLGVCVKTIETYRHNIGRKLGMNSIAEIIHFAFREGIASFDKP